MNDNKDLKQKILQMRKVSFSDISNDESFDEKIVEEKILAETDQGKEKTSPNFINKTSKDEEAFKLLASKFNESVEVILELTTRVEKLENFFRLQSMQNLEDNSKKQKLINKKRSNFKFYVFILMILIVTYFVYYNPIEFKIVNDIIADLTKIINKE